MATTVVEKTYTPVQTESGVYSTRRYSLNYWLQNVLYAILAFIEFVILARIVLVFLGATDTGFAKFIYDLSAPFVAPFFGVFKTQSLQISGYRLEWESIIAAVAYIILFWAISTVFRIFSGDNEY